tara:strand:+ start:2642 stop:3076 length:435 start_codon:yes stop_codon:yes gene_type:complete
MKILHTVLIIILLVVILPAQDNFLKITPKYKHLKLLGEWTFETMKTTTQAEFEEVLIIDKDENNVETISFNKAGELTYNAISDGVEKKGTGTWYTKDNRLRIIADSDTIDGTYQIEEDWLIITTNEKETDDFYAYSIIIKYRAK